MLLFSLSLCGFFGLLLLFMHCGKCKFEDACDYVYILFGFFISRWAEYCLLTTQWTMENIGDETTPLQYWILCVSTAYFLYDIPISFLLKEEFYMTFHHMASFLILAAAALDTRSGLETVICLWLGEFTSPFYFIRLCLDKNEKWKKSHLMIINNVIFLVLFIALRFVMAPYVVYHIFSSAKSAMFIKVGSVLFYIVNFSILFAILKEAKQIIVSLLDSKKAN